MLETTLMIIPIAVLGMISPGPDFFLVMKNSLTYHRKAALLTGLGISTAVLVHMTYCVTGLAIVIDTTPVLFQIIKYIGSAYLIWIGVQALRSKGTKVDYKNSVNGLPLSSWTAFRQGLFCNLLNPKATLFFLAMFSQILDVHSRLPEKMWYAFVIWFLSMIWWPTFTFIIQTPFIRTRLLSALPVIDKLLGLILIGFGIHVALN